MLESVEMELTQVPAFLLNLDGSPSDSKEKLGPGNEARTNWPQNEALVQEKYKEPINGQICRCHSYYP